MRLIFFFSIIFFCVQCVCPSALWSRPPLIAVQHGDSIHSFGPTISTRTFLPIQPNAVARSFVGGDRKSWSADLRDPPLVMGLCNALILSLILFPYHVPVSESRWKTLRIPPPLFGFHTGANPESSNDLAELFSVWMSAPDSFSSIVPGWPRRWINRGYHPIWDLSCIWHKRSKFRHIWSNAHRRYGQREFRKGNGSRRVARVALMYPKPLLQIFGREIKDGPRHFW